jgi:hypothetical protein
MTAVRAELRPTEWLGCLALHQGLPIRCRRTARLWNGTRSGQRLDQVFGTMRDREWRPVLGALC